MDSEIISEIPDGADKNVLSPYLEMYFDCYVSVDRATAMEILNELADKQWHTYEVPTQRVKNKVVECLTYFEDESSEYLEFALSIAYSFGLERKLYSKLFYRYIGNYKSEFSEILANSKGDYIDPYYTIT